MKKIILFIFICFFSEHSYSYNDQQTGIKIISEAYSDMFVILNDGKVLYFIDNYMLLPCTSSKTCDDFEVHLGEEIKKRNFSDFSQLQSFVEAILLDLYMFRSKQSTTLIFAKGKEEVIPVSFYKNQLGKMHTYGLGVKKDIKKGVIWYESAAIEGDMNAQFELGTFYHEGVFFDKNDHKSFNWTLKSAIQGHSAAQYNVAVKYEIGNGVKIDIEKAKSWYLKSSKQGEPQAQYNLGVLYSNDENYIKAYQWISIAIMNDLKDYDDGIIEYVLKFLNEKQTLSVRRASWKCINSQYSDCGL